jgi:hypothetical protein
MNALVTGSESGPVRAREIFFSIVQRKVLTPNDFSSLTALEKRLLDFQLH